MKPVLFAILLAGAVQARVPLHDDNWYLKPVKAAPFLHDYANTASGCHYYISKSCCDNPVCKCPDGKTYEMNGRNFYQNHMHGCDPPGAVMGDVEEKPGGECCLMKGAANKWYNVPN